MSVADLINQLDTASLEARQDLYRQLSAPEAVPALIAAIRSDSGRKCWLAAKALATFAPQQACVPLIEAMKMSKNAMLRYTAVELLGDIEDELSEQALFNMLSSSEGLLQIKVVQSLGKLRARRAVPALIELMQTTPSQTLRYTAIETLTSIGDHRALEPIRCLRYHDDHHVRTRAVRALRAFGETLDERDVADP